MSSDSPRTHRTGRRDRPRASRIVLGTLLVSLGVIVVGYGAGLLIGRVLF
ncbi:MAG: hypothetical protein JWO69_1244 [Thermoleophilia bacterium]|jgi:hypothetical protein|nr:hypothetical protein [Thermoleophilia bacterium]